MKTCSESESVEWDYQYKLENLFPNICQFAYFADNPCHSCFSRKILQQTKACKELFALTHVTHNRLVEFARLIIESEVALKKARKAPLNAIVK
jgi:hypothetical protein